MIILLTEDDPFATKLFREYFLHDLGTEVRTAETTEDALKIQADVVVLDLRLPPEQDEEATLAKIKNFSVPVIAISASPDPTLESRVRQAGGLAFFNKLDLIEKPELLRNMVKQLVTTTK